MEGELQCELFELVWTSQVAGNSRIPEKERRWISHTFQTYLGYNLITIHISRLKVRRIAFPLTDDPFQTLFETCMPNWQSSIYSTHIAILVTIRYWSTAALVVSW